MFRKSPEEIHVRRTMEKGCPTGRWAFTGPRTRPRRNAVPPSSEVLIMREVFMSTLSQVVELGIFAAAAGALAIGMMHVR